MFLKNWKFSKEFEVNVVDSFGFVLAIQPSKRTSEHVRLVMDSFQPTEDEYRCLKAVLDVLNETKDSEGANPETINPESIEEHLLTIPTDVFIKSFDRLSNLFEGLIAIDNVKKGFVSGYQSIKNTLDELGNFFAYLRLWVRQELSKVIEEAFGVRLPEVRINPEDIPDLIFEESEEPEEEPEFEIFPIY